MHGSLAGVLVPNLANAFGMVYRGSPYGTPCAISEGAGLLRREQSRGTQVAATLFAVPSIWPRVRSHASGQQVID